MSTIKYYSESQGKKYFDGRFDKKHQFGRIFQSRYFMPYCDSSKTLLDFGCGDGTFLRILPAKKKIGVELNEKCLEVIEKANTEIMIPIKVYNDLSSIQECSIDIVISNHSLEHTPNPFQIVKEFYRVLKQNGILVLVVPYDDWRDKKNRYFNIDDPDHHLYTWAPQNIGNLITSADFRVKEIDILHTAWSPKFFWIHKVFGEFSFKLACTIFSYMKKRREIFCLAYKS